MTETPERPESDTPLTELNLQQVIGEIRLRELAADAKERELDDLLTAFECACLASDSFEGRRTLRAEIRARLRASSLGEPVSQEAPWVVWSHERSAWWRANRQGYAGSLFGAGVYSEDEAKAIEDDSHRGDVARLLVDEFERQSRVVGTGANWLRTQLAASRVEAKPQNPCVVFGCECPECSASVISSASPLSEDERQRISEVRARVLAAKMQGYQWGVQQQAVSDLTFALALIDRLSASAPSPEDKGSDNAKE